MKTPRAKSQEHLRLIKQLPCLVCGHPGTDPAHIRFSARRAAKVNAGVGAKPHDRWVVPLCREHHDHQHSMNEEQFWADVGIDPLAIAAFLWGETGNHENMEIIVNHAREHRNEEANRRAAICDLCASLCG